VFDDFFDSVCRVGIFVMCAQTIVHFKPREVYEKYLRYLVSVMVLIQLFLPLGGFLFGGGNVAIDKALKQFEDELKNGMEMAEEKAKSVDDKLESMTLEEVRKQMEQQATESDSAEETESKNSISVNIEEIDPITVGN